MASVYITVYGTVQGVFYRAFTARHAKEMGLTGYVHNLHDDNAVEVVAEGEKQQLEKFIGKLKTGPPSAAVSELTPKWLEYTGNYYDFKIRY
ncbi:MAG: acylphosphatase [Dehalococcoidales bacterium]